MGDSMNMWIKLGILVLIAFLNINEGQCAINLAKGLEPFTDTMGGPTSGPEATDEDTSTCTEFTENEILLVDLAQTRSMGEIRVKYEEIPIAADVCNSNSGDLSGGTEFTVADTRPYCSRDVKVTLTVTDATTEPIIIFRDKDDVDLFSVELGATANTKHKIVGDTTSEVDGSLSLVSPSVYDISWDGTKVYLGELDEGITEVDQSFEPQLDVKTIVVTANGAVSFDVEVCVLASPTDQQYTFGAWMDASRSDTDWNDASFCAETTGNGGSVMMNCGANPKSGQWAITKAYRPDCVKVCELEVYNVGPAGIPGPGGVQGDTGATGRDGTDGDTGLEGPEGLQGIVGYTGDIGAQGFTGDIGLIGGNGVAGADGATGYTGVPGTNGAQGQQGTIGAVGPTGDDGTVPTNGINGQAGVQGPTGDTGHTGDMGIQGNAGDDAIDGITGFTGPIGPKGVQGPQGVTGPQGDVGVIGYTGAVGPRGDQGIPGLLPDAFDECTDPDTEIECDLDPLGLATCIDDKYGHFCKCRIEASYGVEWDPATNACVFPPGEELESMCDMNNGGCSQNCTAGDKFSNITCSCDEGFELSINLESCLDVDECMLGEHNCTWECLNLYGTYECLCPPGYTVENNTCIDIDECDDLNAGCSHKCNNDFGGYSCSCPPKYELARNLHTCINTDQTKTKIKFDMDWNAKLADEASDDHNDLSETLREMIDPCMFKHIFCSFIFEEGSVVVTVIMQMASEPLSDDEKLLLTQRVVDSLTSWNGTVDLPTGTVAVIGDLTGESGTVTWSLNSPCDQYEADGYCLMGSECGVMDGQAKCMCKETYIGPQCDRPGPGFNSAPKFSRTDYAQISGACLALFVSIVSIILGAFVLCGEMA